MTTTKLTPSIDWMDAPIESEKWKNLIFLKSGHSCLVRYEYASEKAALEHVQKCEKELYNHNFWRLCDGTLISPDDYSHTIQIPWKS